MIKNKILPMKQLQKWCEKLQISSDSLNEKNIYKNNYHASIETKLRSFQFRPNLRSTLTKSTTT